jgi:hypothetical protein
MMHDQLPITADMGFRPNGRFTQIALPLVEQLRISAER